MASRRLPSLFGGGSSFLRPKTRHFHDLRSGKILNFVSKGNFAAFATGFVSSFAAFELYRHVNSARKLWPPQVCVAASAEREAEAGEAEPKVMSRREKRFNQFASCEYEGQVLMTAQDFIESLTENQPKCKKKFKLQV